MAQIKGILRKFLIHFAVWFFVYAIFLFQIYVDFQRIPSDIFLRLSLGIFLFYLNFHVLVPYLLLKRKTILYFLVSALALIAGVMVFWKFIPFDIPIDKVPPAIQEKFEQGKLPLLIPNIILALHFFAGALIRIYLEWNKSDILKREIETEKVNSELQFLKTQLNPHFLFNSLNAIYSLSIKNLPNTSEAIINLSELMRYMLYEADKGKVALESEIKYLKNYVQLQRLRLSDSENVEVKITGDDRNKKITPLLFISFVENAFKYGTDFNGKTFIKIHLEIQEKTIQFSVVNKIGRHQQKSENSGVGLENVKSRLELLYPNAHSLHIEDDGKYYSVDLSLNLNGI